MAEDTISAPISNRYDRMEAAGAFGDLLSDVGDVSAVETNRFSEAAEVLPEVLREAEAEIAALRAENKRLLDWILGDTDALTCLQAVYQSPESSEYSKIKAAVGALPFERPKLSVAVSVRGPDLLGDCLDTTRMKTINPPKTINHEAD
jgi:hypothetical protein